MWNNEETGEVVDNAPIVSVKLGISPPLEGDSAASSEHYLQDQLARLTPARKAELLAKCENIYNLRRRRDAIFGDEGRMFGEPAWDILLDLFAALLKNVEIPVGSACIAAMVPSTTALRCLNRLEKGNLLIRRKDAFDYRRSYVNISPQGFYKVFCILDGA